MVASASLNLAESLGARRTVSDRTMVLSADPDLAVHVDPSERAVACQASVAQVVALAPGRWSPPSQAPVAHRGIGLLLLDGLLMRRVGWDDRHGAELLAPGDLVRPWDDAGDSSGTLLLQSEWRALASARIAVLDERWATRMSRWPSVQGALTARALDRARRTVMLMALCQIRRLDQRVWLLLWHLAERFGRVHADGVHVEIPITHQTVAELAGARRPSVSAAISRLERQGCLYRTTRGWILYREPPPAVEPRSAPAV